MRILAAILALALMAASARAQRLFEVVQTGPPVERAWQVAGPRPVLGAVARFDPAALAERLAGAPRERLDEHLRDYGLRLALPSPEGVPVECFVAELPVMEDDLQAKFAGIRTYIVQSVDRVASGRMELSQRGLTAMLRTTDGRTWFIDPWRSGDAAHVVSYWLHDLPGADGGFDCHATDDAPEAHGAPILRGGGGGAVTLRTIRFAVACTGEYGLHQCIVQGNAPNAADPLAAIVTVVARTNVVYEADLAVRFVLVSNNHQVVYFNPATDPYPDTCDGTGGGDCSGGLLSVNSSVLSQVIGNSNFDLGHLMTRVYGGVANLSCVCTNNKARGVSGIPRGGDVDPLSALVVIHEIGHQFGARHTFSGTRGRCQGNVTLSTAWEAGSGSSPMAYAGGCPVGDAPPSDNVAIFADPFFHHGSVREMLTLLAMRSCPTDVATSNAAPLIEAVTPNQALPPGTPFHLACEARARDGDALTYSWEQFDAGAARPLTGPDAVDGGVGALFRVFPPVAHAARSFPRVADVLSGTPTAGEMLPTFTGVTRRFRVIVRDNAPGAGGVTISDFVDLEIAAGASPFIVISPAEGAVLDAGPAQAQWTVGGTDAAPIDCAAVEVWLSTDGGAVFDHDLGTFPNTGAAMVMLPEIAATAHDARLRIGGAGRAFYNISRAFVLRAPCPADFDGDGSLDVSDIFAFLNAWFEGHGSAQQFGGASGVSAIFAFLSAWFAGCP